MPPRPFTARATMSRRGSLVRVRVTLSATATVSLRITRSGRTVARRTLRLGAGARNVRFRIRRSRRVTGLAGYAITSGGEVARFGARVKRR
jgi:hypothetical protein